MLKKHICVVAMLTYAIFATQTVGAQVVVDTTSDVQIAEVRISRSKLKQAALTSPMSSTIADSTILMHHASTSLMHTLSQVPGVQSLSIGPNQSKPMIRGQAFARVVVALAGVKQEGQQWGADHGLEIDQFAVGEAQIIKGPTSINYGSDALGGVVEIAPPTVDADGLHVEGLVRYHSVNSGIAASANVGVRKNRRYLTCRYSHTSSADFRVPTDSIVYMSVRLPVYNNRLINTAGHENNLTLFASTARGKYSGNILATESYAVSGFYAAAHGIPNVSSVIPDGNNRNVRTPYSEVNHFRLQTHQQLSVGSSIFSADVAYQQNNRREYSPFHTHYPTQENAYSQSNLETEMVLRNLFLDIRGRRYLLDKGNQFVPDEFSVGASLSFTQNDIGGYSFLLPRYCRQTAAMYATAEWAIGQASFVSAALRYDVGHIDIDSHYDENVYNYLTSAGYSTDEAVRYATLSEHIDRTFGNTSFAIGYVGRLGQYIRLHANVGRSFRLPGANELAMNGVHHGTFRHEQGSADLRSESGLQIDCMLEYENRHVLLSLSPFACHYNNYIYLCPSGQWSPLPDAGQTYKYVGARVVMAGCELDADIDLPANLMLHLMADYIRNKNRDSKTALSYSPPPRIQTRLTHVIKGFRTYAECLLTARQTHIAVGEKQTDGYTLLGAGISYNKALGKTRNTISFAIENLTGRRYFNHLSYYRQIEVPEPDRNITLTLKTNF